jgi:hypothetical protein
MLETFRTEEWKIHLKSIVAKLGQNLPSARRWPMTLEEIEAEKMA